MAIPNKVRERIVTGLKRLLPVIQQQRTRDVSEADTVTLVKDIFADVFGYDKYTDLTSEFAIRSTYCDLAVKIDDKLTMICEVKAIGIQLEERHLRQAVDYASNQGVEWVVLTNAVTWQLYNVIFSKPIDKRLIAEVDLTAIDWRKEAQLEILYLLTKEGVRKGAHIELRDRQDATNRFVLAALITSNESVLSAIRRELRRVVDVLVSEEDVVSVLRNEVMKRDTLEGVNAEMAARRVGRTSAKALRARAVEEGMEDKPQPPAEADTLPEDPK